MIGGLAVRNNLLCVTWCAGRGHVFLYDLDAGERLSSWQLPVGASGFSDAGGVAIDRDFRIFVADPHNNCVRRYNAFGQHQGDLGLPVPESGDRGRDRIGVLDRPHAVAVHLERVYVVMGEQPRQRGVQCFHLDGRVLPGLAARGDAALKWAVPRGIWSDDLGVVISDTLRGRLQCFRHDGTYMHEVIVAPANGAAAAQQVRLAQPGHLVRMLDGTLLIVDHSGSQAELVAIRANGARRAITGLAAACHEPLALAIDSQQRVYVLDHGGERVLRATADLEFDRVLFELIEYDDDAPSSNG